MTPQRQHEKSSSDPFICVDRKSHITLATSLHFFLPLSLKK
jgi:hypothetical protein